MRGELTRRLERRHAGSSWHRVPALFEGVSDAHGVHHGVFAIPRLAMSLQHDRRSMTSMTNFWPGTTVVVTGGAGFLGRVVVANLQAEGATVVAPRSADYDLTVPGAADRLLADHQPSIVIHLAARVGGHRVQPGQPARLYLDNLLMGTHIIEATRAAGTDKTVMLGTVCSYPKFTPVPFREESLWDGYPEETNAPYGIAKKAHLVHAQVNAAQYGQRFAYLIPTNLYGPGDKFHPSVSHVIPALIKKCVEAREAGVDKIDVWGTGRASREYLYVEDACRGDRPRCRAPRLGPTPSTSATIAKSRSAKPSRPSLSWSDTPANSSGTRAGPTVNLAAASTPAAPNTSSAGAPTMPFDEGLRHTIDWYLANREEAERVVL